MIRRILFFTVVSFIAYSCATSKKTADISVGEWEYVVADTPDGDAKGTLSILKEGDVYTGVLHSSNGDMNLENVAIENDELVATFDYSGYTIDMIGKFVGDNFTGKVSVDYNDFPMTAVRKQ
jgi:hypothetical protein